MSFDTRHFSFFISYYESIKSLSPEDAYALVCALCELAFNGKDGVDKDGEALSGTPKAVYEAMKPNVEHSVGISASRSEAGKKGGAPVGNDNAKQTNKNKQKQAKTTKEQTKTSNEQAKTSGIGIGVGIGIGEGNINTQAQEAPPGVEEAIANFVEHRKKLRKPMTDHAIDLFRKRVCELGKTPEEQIELIDHAITKGWLSVYPIEGNPQKPRAPQKSYPQRDYDFDKMARELIKN